VTEKGDPAASDRDGHAAAKVRLDVWLWAVRLFKTRSVAAEACRLGRVTRVDGEAVKPSRPMRAGDEVLIREEFLVRRLRVEQVLERRVGAKLVAAHMTDLTPLADIERARAFRLEQRLTTPVFVPGAGRPTKAQRRALEAWHRAGMGEGREGGGEEEGREEGREEE
jgi:ribosome-associated heat shock protein Hsp15